MSKKFIGENLSAEDMKYKYGLTAENASQIKLDPSSVPASLQHLIPYAEVYGISDDLVREDFFSKTPEAEIEKLKSLIELHDDQFDEWLAGPESKGPEYSKEYIAFSALRMGLDSY